MKTYFEGYPFGGKWRSESDPFEGRMTTEELEIKLNEIDYDSVFEVEELIDGFKNKDFFLEKIRVYIRMNCEEKGKLLYELIPPSDDTPFWYVTTNDAVINAFDQNDIRIYIKALELAEQFMPPKRY